MFSALLILLVLPITDRSIVRGNSFKIISKFAFFFFIFNFALLGHLGELHVEVPFVELGRYCTFLYFAYFLIIVPAISILENILFYIGRKH